MNSTSVSAAKYSGIKTLRYESCTELTNAVLMEPASSREAARCTATIMIPVLVQELHTLLGSFFAFKNPPLFAYDKCRNTSGCCSAILNKATAGPLGLRLPCSQS